MTNTNQSQQAPTGVKTTYVYFVGIQFFTDRGIGFTNLELPLPRKLNNLSDVHQIEQRLRQQGYNDALVMGFSLLRTTTVPTPGRQS